jgi:hypothetical protein
MLRSLLKEFRNPPSPYRAKPFWAWNGKLAPDELRRQVRLMHRMGLGGFFMHSRVGLATKYLSDEWFRCVEACVEEAQSLGMEAWLYDEDRWPSGAAGGIVTRDPRYRQRALVMTEERRLRDFRWDKSVLAAFTARVEGHQAWEVKRLPRSQRPRKLKRGESILVFRVELSQPNSWFNGYTYLDTLNPRAVRRFLAVTHEAYARRLGRHFGRTIPGIFSDEPNHGTMMRHAPDFWAAERGDDLYVPWTERLPAVFQRRYGYDLIDCLPVLFLNVEGEGITPARHDYHDCVTQLFVDAFARQVGAWCEKHRLQFTGHVLHEETLFHQTFAAGSPLRFYEHMQAPGMDLLTQYSREYHTPKQVSSVAHQFGRRWRLTETYGCTGWEFPFRGHKALGDWQVALGINSRCQHLAWYTMEGEAKRDYPASIFYQSPWWEMYPAVEDYFARLHLVMSRGREVRDLLVIHPNESMWTLCRKEWEKDQKVRELDRAFALVRDTLLAGHIDFDYGDEDILARHGRVARRGGAKLVVGQARYRAVVVPPLRTIRQTTLDLLHRFRRAGGTVVFAGSPPQFVDARPSAAAANVARDGVVTRPHGRDLLRAVEPAGRRLSIRDASGQECTSVLYLLREDADAYYLFICNTGHRIDGRGAGILEDVPVAQRKLQCPEVYVSGFGDCGGAPWELDPRTSQVFGAEARRVAGQWRIRTSLPGFGSRLFVIPRKAAVSRLPRPRQLRDVRRQRLTPARWKVVLSESNNLVLDQPRYRIGGERWQATTDILRVDQAVRRSLGLAPRGGFMVQPWVAKPRVQLPSQSFALAYDFTVAALPSGPVFLALEQPARFRIFVNDAPASTAAECGWWVDKSLRRVPLDPSLLRLGTNVIRLEGDYDANYPGLEMVYLLGAFGVRLSGVQTIMTAWPSALKLGDWCRQGLPFYSGAVSYLHTVRPRLARRQRLLVRVPAYEGAAVRVLVDGQAAGVIGWEPHEVDITDFARRPEAELAVQVISHRRNSHGPLHLVDPHPHWVGPGQYITAGAEWRDDYHLVPCGLLEPPCLVTRE